MYADKVDKGICTKSNMPLTPLLLEGEGSIRNDNPFYIYHLKCVCAGV